MKKLFLLTILLGAFLLVGAGCIKAKQNNADAHEDVLGAARNAKIDAIVDDVVYGTRDRNIGFTDDNVGEDFIVKSDAHDYKSWGGGIAVDFSVTNVSDATQNADIVFVLDPKQTLRKISRFDGNQVVEIEHFENVPDSATTTAKTVRTVSNETRAIYTELALNTGYISPDITRKDVKGLANDGAVTDTFLAGETKYYRANVNIPNDANGEEWFIEAFGSKGGYGHLDPSGWSKEETFDTCLVDTELGGNSGGTCNSEWDGTDGDALVQATTKFTGTTQAVKVLGVVTTNNANMGTITDGIVYFAYYEDGAPDNDGLIILLHDGGSDEISLNINAGTIRATHSTGDANIVDPAIDTWYIFKITFDTDSYAVDYRTEADGVGNFTAGSADNAYVGGTGTGITTMQIRAAVDPGAGQDWYIDELSASEPGGVTDTCTPTSGSTWIVDNGDNCNPTANISHDSDLECFNAGGFIVRSGVEVSIAGKVNCPGLEVKSGGKFIKF